MRRRTALRTIAAGAISVTAGCSSGNADRQTPRPRRPGVLNYPRLPPCAYSCHVDSVDTPEGTPTEFEALGELARLELANTVHRGICRTSESPAVLDLPSDDLVDYRGRTFEIGVAVSDFCGETEHGPQGEGEWHDPVTIAGTVSDGELTVELGNELDQPLDVHHFGRPYFGVLVAVGQQSTVLDHDAYETNEHVSTDGLVRTEYLVERKETTTVAPGDALRETYDVPEDLSGESIVRVSMKVGDESVDRLGNEATFVVTRLDLDF